MPIAGTTSTPRSEPPHVSQGVVRRKDKEMSREEAEAFLGRVALGHIGSVDAAGQPYVILNLFVYEAGKVYIHTSAAGHFQSNVERNPRVSFEAADMGTIYPCQQPCWSPNR